MLLLSLVFACATNERVDGILELDGDVGAGEAVYDQHCENCHGTDGQGTDEHPGVVDEMHHGDAMILTWILDGKGADMPAFSADLDDQDAADLLAFLRDLAEG
jgi:mono/diheme cytochrome c family protein